MIIVKILAGFSISAIILLILAMPFLGDVGDWKENLAFGIFFDLLLIGLACAVFLASN